MRFARLPRRTAARGTAKKQTTRSAQRLIDYSVESGEPINTADGKRLICKQESVTNTRLKNKKICLTPGRSGRPAPTARRTGMRDSLRASGHVQPGHNSELAKPMLDLPGHPVIDKTIAGGRLPAPASADRCRSAWRPRSRRCRRRCGARPADASGVHRNAEALFLRGHAPAQGALPIEDREPLALLPYARARSSSS